MVPSLFLLRPPPTDLLALHKIASSRSHGLLSRRSGFPVRISLFPEPRGLPLVGSEKRRQLAFACFCDAKEKLEPTSPEKALNVDSPILQQWDVPWGWQTATLTMIACGVSFVLTGLVEASVLPYLGFQGEVSSEEKAEILFVGQFAVTAVVLGVIHGITNSFRPLPDDIFCYDWKDPFSLRNGWLLWAGIGLVGALIAIALAGVALSTFSGENPQRETDALIHLLPLIGSSSIRYFIFSSVLHTKNFNESLCKDQISVLLKEVYSVGGSTACLVGVTGVLAPILEETVFRGFLMVSLTKWVPTPVSVLISAAVFAIAHLTPGEFPQLFLLGAALGFSYAQTRNLLTPITIHSIWNSGVILLLTFLQLQGYDIRELLQAS